MTTVTPEQIAEWEKEHGEVYEVTVSDTVVKFDPHIAPDDEDADLPNALTAYIHKPTTKVLNFAMSKMPQMIEAGKSIFKSCWLGGNERIKNEPALLTAAGLQCIELLEVRQARLKKLSTTGKQ